MRPRLFNSIDFNNIDLFVMVSGASWCRPLRHLRSARQIVPNVLVPVGRIEPQTPVQWKGVIELTRIVKRSCAGARD